MGVLCFLFACLNGLGAVISAKGGQIAAHGAIAFGFSVLAFRIWGLI